MFKDIIIGQYVPGNSPLHKMNPPVKIIMTILYIVLLFILKNPISYVVFTIYTITLILISGVPFKMILKGLKPMLWIFIFTAVLNVFMTPGDTVWALKIFKFTLKITKEGIESGSLMVIRLLYLVMGTSLLTAAPAGLPCHRVVNSAGRTAPHWTEQRPMLEAEGVRFRKNGCVDLTRSGWKEVTL